MMGVMSDYRNNKSVVSSDESDSGASAWRVRAAYWRRSGMTQIGAALRTGVAAVLILLIGWGGTLSLADDTAASDGQEALYDLSLEELMDIPVDTVYGASKRMQKASEAPSSVTVVTADEIRKYGYRTVAEALRSVPGLYINYDRSFHYLGVRGFRWPGDFNGRILLLIDGHRVNENTTDAHVFGTEFILDVDLIDRLEIIRGPGSSLYGSNALLAVVNVITKTGKDIGGLEVSGALGSFDATKGRVTYGDTLGDDVEVLISGTSYDSDGPELYIPEFDDPATNNGLVRNDDDRFESLVANVQYGDLSLLLLHTEREKGIPLAPWNTVFGDSRARRWTEATVAALTYARDLSETWRFECGTSYGRLDYDADWPINIGGVGDPPDIIISQARKRGRWWEGDVHVVGKPFDRHTVTVGGEFRWNLRQDQSNRDQVVRLDDSRDSQNWGLYVQDEFEIFDGTTIIGGLRYDEYDTFGGSTNPRLALIQEIDEETTLKLLCGRAFRAPNADELYYHDGNTTSKAAQELDPETIDTYEVVLERVLTPHWRGTASGFYYLMDDLIAQEVDPADGLEVYRNIDEVEAHGLELALDGRWESGLQTRASYSYVDAENETTGAALVNSPHHLAKFNLIVPVVEEILFAGLEVQYSGESKTLDDDYADDFVLANLTLTYTSPSRPLEVSVGLYNLFDVEYGHPGLFEHRQDVIEQDGRTFRVSVTYRF